MSLKLRAELLSHAASVPSMNTDVEPGWVTEEMKAKFQILIRKKGKEPERARYNIANKDLACNQCIQKGLACGYSKTTRYHCKNCTSWTRCTRVFTMKKIRILDILQIDDTQFNWLFTWYWRSLAKKDDETADTPSDHQHSAVNVLPVIPIPVPLNSGLQCITSNEDDQSANSGTDTKGNEPTGVYRRPQAVRIHNSYSPYQKGAETVKRMSDADSAMQEAQDLFHDKPLSSPNLEPLATTNQTYGSASNSGYMEDVLSSNESNSRLTVNNEKTATIPEVGIAGNSNQNTVDFSTLFFGDFLPVVDNDLSFPSAGQSDVFSTVDFPGQISQTVLDSVGFPLLTTDNCDAVPNGITADQLAKFFVGTDISSASTATSFSSTNHGIGISTEQAVGGKERESRESYESSIVPSVLQNLSNGSSNMDGVEFAIQPSEKRSSFDFFELWSALAG
ncbi:hypothetical protein GYMLUDRAFT_57348 [Collybiopsis luxurians FD-317 M1]|uniref:Uncharacterized protein n=1 Tax=Collybiopsis luxurians FD-317 M1 TaxID=944289 RepID=A0A0D0D350_9AGAR|nr:hypothetical protein GYMLUDRAFT_57348 [Collybiopsis luxurians FD-317 M1]